MVLGGGAVDCELAQAYARFGARVTLVEAGRQLLPGEPGAVAGRPATGGLELDALGIEPDDTGALPVDEGCRVHRPSARVGGRGRHRGGALTHTANHQAGVVRDNLLGGDRRVVATAIPRVVYTDPPVASVGRLSGHGVVTATTDLADVARTTADGSGGGLLVLAADRTRAVLVGASAVGPQADEWLAEATLAVRAGVPLRVLREVVHPFPTYSEAYELALRDLEV